MKEEKPGLVFIQEKKCSVDKIREIHNKWLIKYEYLEVKVDNATGGILTLWKPQKLGILDAEASMNYLSVVIQPLGDKEVYLITNVYGPQKIDEKLRFLNSLVDLRSRHKEIPWVIGGDFNMITSLMKKRRHQNAQPGYRSFPRLYKICQVGRHLPQEQSFHLEQ